MPQRGTTDDRRRLALQIAAQLPERVVDALGVLDDARELVVGFLVRGPRLVAEAAGAAAPAERRPSAAIAILCSFVLGLAIDLPPFPPVVTKALASIVELDLALGLMPL